MLLLALLLACPPAPPAAPPPEVPVSPAPPPPTCTATWHRDSGASVLREQRATGASAWSDFATGYAAAPIDAGTQAPVEHTRRFQVGGQPLLWFTPDRASVVVDATAFGDLAVVDATRLSADDGPAAVGRVLPGAREALGDRSVVEFLVEADAIRIYAHVEGTLCLLAEESGDGAYVARFSGEHVYFTNKANHDALSFEVAIDASGAITARGL